MDLLVVALGNPGNEYVETRHNVGWMTLEHLNFRSDLNWRDKYKGEYCSISKNDKKIHFLKPMTYMNLSGQSVSQVTTFFKIKPSNILVIHDELDLPFGTISFKKGGGLAGHNGLKSIAELLGTKDFLRLRIGIGRPRVGSVSSFVLSKFSQDEQIDLEKILGESANAIEKFIENGFDSAARTFNKKKIIEEV